MEASASLAADVRDAMLASKIVSYSQGFQLLREASRDFNWGLDLAVSAELWRAGCIIRSSLLNRMAAAFRKNPDLTSLLCDEWFRQVT